MVRMRMLTVLAGVAAVVFVGACSDDTEPSKDSTVAADKGVDKAKPKPDAAPDQAKPKPDTAPDQAKPKPDGTQTKTFTLEGTIAFGFLVPCNPKDTKSDCQGDVYWALYDKKPDPNKIGTPFHSGKIVKNAKKGTKFKESNIPIKPQMWTVAFMDDNNNVTPSKMEPDKGDPVHMGSLPFTANPGDTKQVGISFDIRLP